MEQHAIYLVPSYDQAQLRRKALIGSGVPSLGLTVTTFESWLENAWDLWGDDRALINGNRRLLLTLWLLEEGCDAEGGTGLPVSVNVATMIADFIKKSSGLEEFEAALEQAPADLASNEAVVLELCRKYRGMLASKQLIEPGMALSWLDQNIPAIKETRFVVDEPCLFDLRTQRYLEDHGIAEGGAMIPERTMERLAEGIEPHLLFPLGPSAEPALVVQQVASWVGEKGSAAIIHKDPLSLYDKLRPGFEAQRISVSAEGSIPFTSTEFGRAFFAVVSLFAADESTDLDFVVGDRVVLRDARPSAADFLASPYSGVSQWKARELDAKWRGDRSLSAERYRRDLADISESYRAFELLLDPVDGARSGGFEVLRSQCLSRFGRRPAYCDQQLTALESLRRMYEQCWALGLTSDLAISIMQNMQVTASASSSEQVAQVRIMSPAQIQRYGSGSFDAVLVCNADAATYSMKQGLTSVDVLGAKLGFRQPRQNLAYTRFCFSAAQLAARSHFGCEATCVDADGAENFPAFFFDELLDAYREPNEERGGDYMGTPQALMDAVAVRGEEVLEQNLTLKQPARRAQLPASMHGGVGEPDFGKVLSPSGIETYIECPYKWFINKKINPQGLDAEWGPLAAGNFSHQVYQAFYGRLAERGYARVTPENLAEAQELMGQVFDELLELQSLDPEQSVQYVPCNQIENYESATLRQGLIRSVGYFAQFLPGFETQEREYGIDFESGVNYGGCKLVGRVDRVDVNPAAGTFAIIDYKRSADKYAAGFDPDGKPPKGFDPDPEKDYISETCPTFVLPSHVQALIYAQAVRRLLGLDPVAAVYVGYSAQRSDKFARGSYNATRIVYPGVDMLKSQVAMDFGAYLDEVEKAVAWHIAKLQAGDIAPNPRNAEVCKYCNAVNCGRRL